MSADEIIAALNMRPHPEGGHYVETYRADTAVGERAACTAIYFLLRAGESSHWHRVDATEIWLWHAGAPLTLSLSANGDAQTDITLGPNLANGEQPQAIVPMHHWQAARGTGDWTLVSCVVAPGFDFAGFELAPPDWAPRS